MTTPPLGAERLLAPTPTPTTPPSLLAAAAACLAIGCASYVLVLSKANEGGRRSRSRSRSRRREGRGDDDDKDGLDVEVEVPDARGGVPLLGHALLYRKDPASFLVEQSDAVGPVFRINLAGKRMIVVCGGGDDGGDVGRSVLRQVATAPESVLSARDAVAAVGFEETLGIDNVRIGTDFHKRVIRNRLAGGPKFDAEVPRLYRSLKMEFEGQILRLGQQREGGRGGVMVVPDLFHLVRLCTLRAVVDRLLGPTMLGLCDGVDLVDRFMDFQDSVEDATAKAAVLPRWLSLPLVLWPVARVRRGLQSQLASLVEEAWRIGGDDGDDDEDGSISRDRDGSTGNGPWLDEFRDAGLSAERAGELIVGLLFAAHKNAAIGSAQALLFLLSRGTPRERAAARAEADGLAADPPTAYRLESSCPSLRRCCLETLRLTSHSIGAVRVARRPFVLDLSPSSSAGRRRRRTVTIPAGETVALSHIASSLDESSWGPAASEYVADRPEWTADAAAAESAGGAGGRTVGGNDDCDGDGDGGHSAAVPPPDEYKFAAFSHGTHACPGRGLALATMQLSLAILLTYDAEVVGDPPDLSFERATLAQRDGPVAVSFRAFEKRGGDE